MRQHGLWLSAVSVIFLGGCSLIASREVTLPAPTGGTPQPEEERQARIITVLPRDAIPAILDPEFLTPQQAAGQMRSTERVMGVFLNGEARAYPINMLSVHEIVNDTVGSVPIAVTY